MDLNKAVEMARSWVGVPWVHAGRNPEYGIDCQGIITESFRRSGWRPNDPEAVYDTSYGQRPDVRKMMKVLQGEGELVPVAEIKKGDVILFRPFHLALVTSAEDGEVLFLHSNRILERVTETRLDGTWKERILGIYRFVGGAPSEQ